MKASIRALAVKFYQCLEQFGFDPLRTIRAFRALPGFVGDWFEFSRKIANRTTDEFGGRLLLYPQVGDQDLGAGAVTNHYFQMDLFVAQLVCAARPQKHVDIGSRIDGFVAHVASSMPVTVLDIRPLADIVIKNISFQQADLMDESRDWDAFASESVSCLHALEHFGLGRYGDDLDPVAYERGIRNLTRMVKKGGILYLAVPVSVTPRIEFNAHRVFSFPHLRKLVTNAFNIESVAIVDDKGFLQTDLAWDAEQADRSWDCRYGCVIMALRKQYLANAK